MLWKPTQGTILTQGMEEASWGITRTETRETEVRRVEGAAGGGEWGWGTVQLDGIAGKGSGLTERCSALRQGWELNW